MLTIEKILATVTAVKLAREKSDQARRRYALTLTFECEADDAAELAPEDHLQETFWDADGLPQLTGLYPLRPAAPVPNCAVEIRDSLSAALALEAVDVTKIRITPKLGHTAKVECTLAGVLNDPRPVADRFWRLLDVPTEISIKARQIAIDWQERDQAA
jgi:hypothetical protein